MAMNKDLELLLDIAKSDTPQKTEAKPKGLAKPFFILFLCLLGLSALTGILLLLSGDFDFWKVRILATSLMFSMYSLFILCFVFMIDRNRFKIGAFIGLAATILGMFFGCLFIWARELEILFFRLAALACTSSIGLAHIGLLFLLKARSLAFLVSRIMAIISVVTTHLTISIMLGSTFDVQESGYFRTLGVFAILGAFSTSLALVSNALEKKKSENNQRGEASA